MWIVGGALVLPFLPICLSRVLWSTPSYWIWEGFGLLWLVGLGLLAFAMARHAAQDSVDPAPETRKDLAWGDEPVDLRTRDEFGRLPFALQLQKVVNEIGANRPSSVIGLAGSWGAGKSSVLVTLTAMLKDDDTQASKWLVASLNPWRYPNADALTMGFFSELRAALPKDEKWSEARSSIAGIVKAISPLGSLTSLVGVDSSKSLEGFAKQLDGIDSASRVQKQAEVALWATNRPVLMVIDDIDRLEPHELLNLFRLVRLAGRLPNVHYLLAYDQETLEAVLTQTDLVSEATRARDYLEKIVQVRIDLPPVRPGKTEKVVDSAIEGIAAKFNVSLTDARSSHFAMTYHEFIAPTLNTPRTVRRWFAHLELLFPPLVGEADFVDFAIVLWISLRHPQIPQMLQKRRSDVFPSRSPMRMFQQVDPEEMHAHWLTWIADAGVPLADVNSVFGALARLFPTIDQAYRKSKSSPDLETAGKRFGIGHPDYFDRYFNLGVPDEELAESAFIEDLESILRDPAVGTRLEKFVRADARSMVPRLEAWIQDHPAAKRSLFLWLSSNLYKTSDNGLFSSQAALRGLLFRLSRTESFEEVAVLLAPLWSNDELVRVAAIVVNDLLSDRERTPALEALVKSAVSRIKTRSAQLIGVPSDRPQELWDLLWLWQALDNNSLRTWYRARLTSGGWTPIEALACIVQSATPVGVPNPVGRLRGIPTSTIEAFLGVEWITDRLKRSTADSGPESPANDFDGPEDTWENRLAVARRVSKELVST